MVVPPQDKDMKDAAVQSEPLAVIEEKQIDGPVPTAGEKGRVSFVLTFRPFPQIYFLSFICYF